VIDGLKLDRRRRERLGAETLETIDEFGRLVCGARDHDPSAEERTTLVPLQRLAPPHGLTDDEDCRGREACSFDALREVADRADYGLLIGARTGANACRGRLGGLATLG
jgi:hypothetical protein